MSVSSSCKYIATPTPDAHHEGKHDGHLIVEEVGHVVELTRGAQLPRHGVPGQYLFRVQSGATSRNK